MQSSLKRELESLLRICIELPGKVSVIEYVVTVKSQICHVVVDLSDINGVRRKVRGISVAEDESELQPLGEVEEDGEEDAGQDVGHEMNHGGVAGNIFYMKQLSN